MTVSAIARDAGVPNFDKWISLDELTDEEVIEASKEYTVFGRVKPHQKKLIVQTLKKNGHLRGCIGSIIPHQPLISDLIQNAQN